MAITNSREFTINIGKIADAEKWLSEGADLWKEITGKDAVIYKEGWGEKFEEKLTPILMVHKAWLLHYHIRRIITQS